MISKNIHYIWMGKNPKSELILRCMETWEEHLKGYEITEWNESNFDITSNPYVKQAYENKKWAFVSDYVRLYVLYNYGGIYLDTDMEILKPIDKFLKHGAFSGFLSMWYLQAGLMGADKGHPWIEDLLKYYDNKSFINKGSRLDLTPNTVNITKQTRDRYGLILNNNYQNLIHDLHIYPKETFCPSDDGDSPKQILKKITNNSYSIHHYNGSWLTASGKAKLKLKKMIGTSTVNRIKSLTSKIRCKK